MKFLLVFAFLIGSVAMAQTSVTVKSSPAVDALNHAAQDLTTEQKSLDTILQQARSNVDASQKSIQAELQKANTDLLKDLKADKKYKDRIAALEEMQKRLQTIGQQAEQKYQQEAGSIQNKVNTDKALIDGLIPVVRSENNLPTTATYDQATQKWTVPQEPKK